MTHRVNLAIEIFNAIINQRVLAVKYKDFKSSEPYDITFHPYFLKQFNNRWFVLGTHSKYEPITTLSIDRIISIKEVKDLYQVSAIDFLERYEDVIGVTRGLEEDVTTITLHANKGLAAYMLTQPMHGSQKNGVLNDEGLTFTLDVIPNYELEQQILSFGEAIKVVSPESFVEKIKERIKASLENY